MLLGLIPVTPSRSSERHSRSWKGTLVDLGPDLEQAALGALQPPTDEFHVCMTRARERARVVVPDQVHQLWLPLVNACIRIANEATA